MCITDINAADYDSDGWAGLYACSPPSPWQPDPFPMHPPASSTATFSFDVPARPFRFNTAEYWSWWKGYLAGNNCTADQMLRAIEEDRAVEGLTKP